MIVCGLEPVFVESLLHLPHLFAGGGAVCLEVVLVDGVWPQNNVNFVSYAHNFAVFCLQNNKKRRKIQLDEARKQVAEGATL